MEGNVGGFEHSAAADISELRQKLKGYGREEAFLKEILQNTDDAKATLQRIAWLPGNPDAAHPLLRGPALVLINNKSLEEREVRAIRRMGLGTKGSAEHAIGKFGQGIKTIFQVCEAFFFLARNPTVADEPNVRELCNPWGTSNHTEWNRFKAEDTAEIMKRTMGLLPDGPWFMLFLPLRREQHLRSEGGVVHAIVERRPGDATECPAEFRQRVEEDLPALLPLLKNVEAVEFYERWTGEIKSDDLTISIEADSRRCEFDANRRSDLELRGCVLLRGAVQERVPFFGMTRWINTEEVQALSQHDFRPRIVSIREDAETIETREKAYPHVGIAVSCRRCPEPATGRIELRWTVFLPVGRDSLECLEWSVPINLRLHLHGYFFLDATRTRVDGQDATPPFERAEIKDEQTFCREWNRILAREGTLPLLPQVLEQIFREELNGDIDQVAELTTVLRQSRTFTLFAQDITRSCHWALCVRHGELRWEAVPVKHGIIAVPPWTGDGPEPIGIVFPGLKGRDLLAGSTVVIHEGNTKATHYSSLLGAEPSPWDVQALREAFEGISPGAFQQHPDARHYLLLFLEGLAAQVRLEALEGPLRTVALFNCEDARTGNRRLLSPAEIREKRAANRLFAMESDPGLARALVCVVHEELWTLADSHAPLLDPALQGLPLLKTNEAAKFVLACAQLGGVEARHRLLHCFLDAHPNLREQPQEQLAARYLLHATFDRKEIGSRLYLQSPDSPPRWLEIARYLLEESAEDWRLLPEWVDLTMEQRAALGVDILDAGAALRLLGEIGPVTDFTGMEPALRGFILKECSNLELLRQLRIYELTTADLTTAGDGTYLESHVTFADAADQELWQELSKQSRIVRRVHGDEVLAARQREVFEGRVVDDNGIIRMAISHDEPRVFWPLILTCLYRVGTPIAEVRKLLIVAENRWLPLQNGRFVAAPNVLSMPDADEAIQRLLGDNQDGAVSILSLDERVQKHRGFPSLKSQVLPPITLALEALAIALAMRDDCRTGVLDIVSAEEMTQLCVVLTGFDSTAYPLLPLMQAMARDPNRAEAARAEFNKTLAGALPAPTTFQVLEFLIGAHQGAAQHAAKEILRVFRLIFLCAVTRGQWTNLCDLGIRLPNRRGEWRAASDLVHNYEGADEGALVDEEIGHALPNRDSEPLVAAGNPAAEKEETVPIEEYARQLAAFVPEQFVGLLVTVMGGTPEPIRVAEGCLGGMDPETIMGQVIGNQDPAAREHLIENWRHTRFFPEFHRNQVMEAISLTGTQIAVPVRMDNPSLLCGSFASAVGDPFAAGSVQAANLRLLDLGFFTNGSREEWGDRAIETAKIILREHYLINDFTGLNGTVDRLRQSRGIFDVDVAQRMVVKIGDHLIQILGAQSHTSLRGLLGRWQQARQWEAQADIGAGEEALRNRARKQSLQAESEFIALLTSDATARQMLTEGMRRRIEDFQYFEDSVLFELFQNADDATIEWRSLANVSPSERPGTFLVRISDGGVQIAAHGRPINRPHSTSQEYGRDLVKMLLLNSSDKNTSLHPAVRMTGRFGLGFKSVHLISDEPRVVSGDIAFKVRGSIFPEAIAAMNLPPELKIPDDADGTPATVIDLPFRAGLSKGQVVERFLRLAPLLVIFAKCIRRIEIEAEEPHQAKWLPVPLRFFPEAEIGEIAALDGQYGSQSVALILRSEDSESSLLLFLSPSGFEILPAEIPAVWATCPLSVEGGALVAVNGSFEVDAGRRQLASESEKNERLFEAASARLGAFLVALAKEMREDWPGVARQLRLSPDTDCCSFWIRLWKSLPIEPSKSGIPMLIWNLLFSGCKMGCSRALVEEEVLPTMLGRENRLTRWREVRNAVAGILDECLDIFEALRNQDDCGPRDTISDSRVLRQLQRWVPQLPLEGIRKVKLENLLVPGSVQGEPARFDPACANRLGKALTKARINTLQADHPSLWQNEWKPIEEKLSAAHFMCRDGRYRPASTLLRLRPGQHNDEEGLRASFAPESAILADTYSTNGVEFFVLCRGELQLGSDILIDWAREATGKRLAAVLRYLLKGDARLRDKMVTGLGAAWLKRIETTPEFVALLREQQETLWAAFKYGLQYGAAQPAPNPDDIIRTTPERLLEWWRQKRAVIRPVQLTGEWGVQIFHGLLTEFDEPAVAAALRNRQSVIGRHAWFRTLCFCCLLGTRTNRDSIPRFLQTLVDQGFMNICSGAVPSSMELFEQEISRIFVRVMETPLHGENAEGEDAEFLRRIFYDARKMHEAVYVNDLPATLFDVIDTAREARGPALMLRSGVLSGQRNIPGVIGQSFSSPILFLLRELRRIRVIETDRFDRTCFYPSAPVVRAINRLGIRGVDEFAGDDDISFTANLAWSEALFDWVSTSAVAHTYLTECFEMPFQALEELDAYDEL